MPISRLCKTALVCLLFVWSALVSLKMSLADAATERTVVVISVDGLAAFYFDDSRAEMPNIRGAGERRARATAMQATTDSHVAEPYDAGDGRCPGPARCRRQQVFDRASGKTVALSSDPTFDKDQIVKVPTIYDVAHRRGMKTAAIRWPATRDAQTLDWTFPDVNSVSLLTKYMTPSLLAECLAASIWSDSQIEDPAEPDKATVSDELATRVFQHILQKHRPWLGLLHVIDVDHVQHKFGPRTPEAYAAIKAADQQVGRFGSNSKKR